MKAWEKKGVIFHIEKTSEWMASHAANPVALHLNDDVFRIYFSARDTKNRSSIAFVEIDIEKPEKILSLSEKPVLSPGPPGTFDDSGVSMSCLTLHGKDLFLYYLGWNLSVTVPWRNSVGLAISHDGGQTFNKKSLAPIMDRNNADPYSISYPWVIKEKDRWKMWYGSNLSWGTTEKQMQHTIKYAESIDGIHWERSGLQCLTLQDDEFALARPCVLHEGSRYSMWYSYRGIKNQYQIGYATSNDGTHWTREDNSAGISCSKNGWDSESIEYAHVFEHKNKQYMLYCGNRYGLTGFGLAVRNGSTP